MQVAYDPDKRQLTLEKRGLDFEDAPKLFAGVHYTKADLRFDYGEEREISVGLLDGSVVVVVWTDREDARRIISMRKADATERADYHAYLAGC